MSPTPLEPLVLAQAATECDVDEDTLGTAVALALLPDGPDRAVPGWWDDAPCAGLDPNEFYPVRGQATGHLRALCAGCPVRAACLASALYNGEMHGWWGGTSANGRKRLRVVLRTAGVMGVVGEDAYLAWREDDRDPPDLAPARYPAREPWPHQLEAVAAVIGALDVGGRCQVSMATASGKTHVAVWSASSLGVERVLVLVPSLALIAQTADVWATDAHWGGARRLAVCSDTGELELEATTDPATVGAFLDAPGPALVFATYHSSDVLVAAARRFDLTVADEAHHLAGQADKAFASVLRGEIPTDRTLYMTATPRRFRRSGGDSELVGMDAEVFGPRVFDFPLSDAVAAGVVADYRVIVAAVERKVFDRVAALPEMAGIDPYLLAGAIAVVRTMGEMRLGSCVSFHTRVDRARTFAQLIGVVADALGTERPPGHGWSGFVHGDTSMRIRRRLLARLADDRSWGVLGNAKALGEGVDMPALDCVAIVDPKNSEIEVMQATGRALRRPTSSKVGTVLLPVLLAEEPDPSDPLAGCDRRSVDLVAGVLRALSSHDNQLSSRLTATRRQLGERTRPGAGFGATLRRRAARGLLRSRVELRVPGGATGDIAGAMALHLVRQATPSWDEAHGRLLAYVAEVGAVPGQTVTVPDDTGTFSLGAWCSVQRTLRRRGLLAAERAAALEAVPGWAWEPRDEGWWAKLDLLREFVLEHGRDPHNLEVWRGHKPGQFLNSCRAAMSDHDGHWLLQFPDRIAALEAIPGWCWNTKDRQWDESFAKLEKWVAQTGTAAPTVSDTVDGFRIGRWCNKQRSRIRDGSLREDRIDRLRALPGWVDCYFAVYDASWEEGFLHLVAFVEAHGRQPRQKETYAGYRVGAWVVHQRHATVGPRARSTMTPARIERLEAVPGWVWDTNEAAWTNGLARMQAFSKVHYRPGELLRIPQGALSSWATGRRMEHSQGRLAPDRVAALEAIPGWVWDVRDAKVEAAVAAVGEWLARERARDPLHDQRLNGVPVRSWIMRWRREQEAGELDPVLAARLESLPGWSWSPLPTATLLHIEHAEGADHAERSA